MPPPPPRIADLFTLKPKRNRDIGNLIVSVWTEQYYKIVGQSNVKSKDKFNKV